MDDALGRSPEREEDRTGPTSPYHALALRAGVLLPDLLFFSDIVGPDSSWSQKVLELGWAAVGYLALTFRSSAPPVAYGLAWLYAAGGTLLTLLGVFVFTPFFVLLVALYAMASGRTRRESAVALALSAVPAGLAVYHDAWRQASPSHQLPAFISSLLFYTVLIVEAYAVGRWSRTARLAAERHRRGLAESRAAILAERLRIARELHDILAHTVTVMVLQASGARRVLATDPERAQDALRHIEAVGADAMGELKHLLALIRSPDSRVEGSQPAGLADLGRILHDASQAGVSIGLQVEGTPAALPESMDRTLYRVVQEAVTNITKHAGPGTAADLRLVWTRELRVEITDDGSGTRPPGSGRLSTGHGLIGLRERVQVFGGTLTAGPHGTGFRVTATLPLPSPGGTASDSAAVHVTTGTSTDTGTGNAT